MHETDGLNSNELAECKVRKCKQAKSGIFLQNKNLTGRREGRGQKIGSVSNLGLYSYSGDGPGW